MKPFVRHGQPPVNPFETPREHLDDRKVFQDERSPSLFCFFWFWIGSTGGALSSSWLLSREYVFVQWPSDPALAVLRTILISVVPYAVFQIAKWRRKLRTQRFLEIACAFFLVSVTDIVGSVLQDVLRVLAPMYSFRYLAICLFLLIPMAYIVAVLISQLNSVFGSRERNHYGTRVKDEEPRGEENGTVKKTGRGLKRHVPARRDEKQKTTVTRW